MNSSALTHRMQRLALALAVLLILFSTSRTTLASDESVDGFIGSVKVKVLAKKYKETVDLIHKSSGKFDDDPRTHYYLAVSYDGLKEFNKAADACEIAVERMESHKEGDAPNPSILSIEKELQKLSQKLLKFRSRAYAATEKYLSETIPLAKTMIEEKQLEDAAYILCELRFVTPDRRSKEIAFLSKKAPKDKAIKFPWKEGDAPDDESKDTISGLIRKARSELKNDNAAQCLVMCDAVLELDNRHQEAYYLSGQAYAKQKKVRQAIKALTLAVESPAKYSTNARSLASKALKVMSDIAPEYSSALSKRNAAARSVVVLYKNAARDKSERKEAYLLWLSRYMGLIAPAQYDVLLATERTSFESRGSLLRALPARKGESRDLLKDQLNWEWIIKTNDSAIDKKQILLYGDTYTQILNSKEKFGKNHTFSFEAKFQKGQQYIGRVYIYLTSKDVEYAEALVLKHDFKFVEWWRIEVVDDGMSKRIGQKESIKKSFSEKFASEDTWRKYEVTWNEDTKKLTLSIQGEKVFDEEIKDSKIGTGVGFAFNWGTKLFVRNVHMKS